MGYDKGDLAFVIHLGSPSSPIAYYQQVGRAGRAIDSARAVLLPTAGDRDIWKYFDSTAFPPQQQVTDVLACIESQGPISVPNLELNVNMSRGRLEALLKVLDVDGAVEREGTGWRRTAQPWTYDTDRLAAVAAARAAEQSAMVAYAASGSCRMRLLREALDDPEAADCGRCDNCTGTSSTRVLPSARIDAAQTELRAAEFVFEPRKQWPRGNPDRSGNIDPSHRAEAGRALSFGSDPGWSTAVRTALDGPDAPVPDELVDGIVAVLKRWTWTTRPTWVCPMPSASHPLLVASLAERIAAIGKLALVPALVRSQVRVPQRAMENSTMQATNVIGAFTFAPPAGADLPRGPVLLVDDTTASGWTMTVAAEVLRSAGSGPVLPLVLWRRP